MFLTIKTSSQNISITLLQISLKLHEHWGPYWRKKLPWTILEGQFSKPRYTAASKIGKSVISLLWQLRWRCNPDHNKFSSLSNTTVGAIFPKSCLWRRSLCSNLGGKKPRWDSNPWRSDYFYRCSPPTRPDRTNLVAASKNVYRGEERAAFPSFLGNYVSGCSSRWQRNLEISYIFSSH